MANNEKEKQNYTAEGMNELSQKLKTAPFEEAVALTQQLQRYIAAMSPEEKDRYQRDFLAPEKAENLAVGSEGDKEESVEDQSDLISQIDSLNVQPVKAPEVSEAESAEEMKIVDNIQKYNELWEKMPKLEPKKMTVTAEEIAAATSGDLATVRFREKLADKENAGKLTPELKTLADEIKADFSAYVQTSKDAEAATAMANKISDKEFADKLIDEIHNILHESNKEFWQSKFKPRVRPESSVQTESPVAEEVNDDSKASVVPPTTITNFEDILSKVDESIPEPEIASSNPAPQAAEATSDLAEGDESITPEDEKILEIETGVTSLPEEKAEMPVLPPQTAAPVVEPTAVEPSNEETVVKTDPNASATESLANIMNSANDAAMKKPEETTTPVAPATTPVATEATSPAVPAAPANETPSPVTEEVIDPIKKHESISKMGDAESSFFAKMMPGALKPKEEKKD
jgi:hypothetical protein